MKFSLLILISCFSLSLFPQKLKVKTVCKLPTELFESSGLVTGTDNSIWTHNDSGGEPYLYKLNSKGEITRKLFIKGLKNTDWEDMANDYQGFVYIADIGNNLNRRKNLSILKLPHPDSLFTDTIVPQITRFAYPNQKAFPSELEDMNFDAEALVAYEDSLFIFTKNRTKPYSKYTYIYSVKNEAGEQEAVLRDSIFLKTTHKYRSWVTGAARNPNKDQVVLISHKKAWLINDFRKGTSFELIPTKISGIYSQKEAIAINLNEEIWISNEKFKFLRAKLKKGRLK